MANDRLEERLADLRRRRDEARTIAEKARDDLVQEALSDDPDEQDRDAVRANGDDYADKLATYQTLAAEYDRWRKVL